MLLDLIPAPYRIVAALAAVAAACASSAFATYRVEEWRWNSAMADQKEEAAKVIVASITVARQQEKEAGDLNLQVETQHAQSLQTRADQLATSLADARRLRDPGRWEGCPDGTSQAATTPGGGDEVAGGNELSVEAGDFLRRLANACDRNTDQLIGCQTYAVKLWAICNGGQASP